MWESAREMFKKRSMTYLGKCKRTFKQRVMYVFGPPHPTAPSNYADVSKTCKTLVRFSTRWLKHRQAQIPGVLSAPGPNPCSPEPGTCDVPNLVAPGWSEPKVGSTRGQDQTTRINRNGIKGGSKGKIN